MVRDGGDPCSVPVKWVKKKVSYGGVFHLAAEQPQLFGKQKLKLKNIDCLSPFCFLLIEFHFTFSIVYKILPYYVYYYYILIRM